ncbi:MAG: hypothetical protein V4706_02805 [Pseudomonadota bacterium]
MAEVIDPAKPHDPVLLMHHVQLVGMSAESLVIEGTVGHSFRGGHKSKVEYFSQRWLLKPPGTKVVIDAEKLRNSKASLTDAMKADPFHPVWDNVDDTHYGPLDPSIS